MDKKVDDIMSRQLHYINEKMSLQDAHEEMNRRTIRHLLVADAKTGKLVGLISDRDIKRYSSPFATAQGATDRDKATLHVEVGKIMTKNLITVKQGDKLKVAVETMLLKRISGVPVVDTLGKAVGMITTTDVLRYVVGIL